MTWVDKLLARSGLTQCPGCHRSSSTPGLCRECVAGLPVNTICCRHCALPLPHTAICLECQQRPPPWSHCHAPWRYATPLRPWLQRAKFHQDLVALRVLCELARQQIPKLKHPDAICPVAMPARRLRRRGVNLAAELARVIARDTGRPLQHALQSTESPLQSQQNRRQRLHLSEERFCPTRPLQGQHILLIDDVMTTGATLRAASKALLAGGAGEVQVMALLRTPQRGPQLAR